MFVNRCFLGLLVWCALAACSCAAPFDMTSAVGRAQIDDQVNAYLTDAQCTSAVDLIGPLYNSSYTDDTTRMLAASAYGCAAGMNFLSFLDDVLKDPAGLLVPELWKFVNLSFPSALSNPSNINSPPADDVAESAISSSDALMSVLKPGVTLLPATSMNYGGYNPGALSAADRTDDANIYLAFISMAVVGSLEGRFGAPDSVTGAKTQDLPWTTGAAVDTNGCSYAASVLNMVDSMEQVGNFLSQGPDAAVGQDFLLVVSQLKTVLDDACKEGCNGDNEVAALITDPLLAGGGNWVPSGCSLACATCPLNLRDRTACQGASTDLNSCAAAGIVNFVNSSVTAGWN